MKPKDSGQNLKLNLQPISESPSVKTSQEGGSKRVLKKLQSMKIFEPLNKLTLSPKKSSKDTPAITESLKPDDENSSASEKSIDFGKDPKSARVSKSKKP